MKHRAFIALFLFLLFASNIACAETQVCPGFEFVFGTYEQDNVLANGGEPIEWQVLSVDYSNGTMMALSKYLLDCQQYNKKTSETPWKNSHMRNWLNDTFYNAAFSDAEKQMIQNTTVNNSQDYVFLLDAQQITNLLDDELCYATAYAKKQGVYVAKDIGTSSWWVRKNKTTTYGAFVGAHGKIYDKNTNKVTTNDNGIRPAIVLALSYLTEDTPGARLDDLHVNDRITIDNWGTLQITSVRAQDKLGYFKAGQYGRNSGDFQNYYDSGIETEYVVLKMSIVNQSDYKMNYLQNFSVRLVFNDTYQYGGWAYQYNYANGTSTSRYVNEEDCGRQNSNYVIDKSDNFTIAPGEKGYYCFGCTVPNAVLEMSGTLQLVIEVDGHKITHNIRK